MNTIIMLSGVYFLGLGIVGEYPWREFRQTRNLPNFVVETVLERDDQDQAEDA